MNDISAVSPQLSSLPNSGLELKNLKRQVLKYQFIYQRDAYDIQTIQRSPPRSQANP